MPDSQPSNVVTASTGATPSFWWRESVAPVLAIIVVLCGFLVIIYKPEAKTEIIALMTMVIAFYFGRSKGSQAKDDTIKEQLDKK